jgi:transcriptional regulator with XRE-family HTH domain
MQFMNMKVSDSDFGHRLRATRKVRGYTLDQLAEISGISKRMISHYETQVKRPSIDKIRILADALHVSINDLIASNDTTKSKKGETKTFLKILKKARIIEQLPEREQKAIFNFINTVADRNKLLKEKKSDRK